MVVLTVVVVVVVVAMVVVVVTAAREAPGVAEPLALVTTVTVVVVSAVTRIAATGYHLSHWCTIIEANAICIHIGIYVCKCGVFRILY